MSTRKILKYTVLNGSNQIDLINKVTEYLTNGYELQGGVSVMTTPTQYIRYSQAMVLYED